MDIKKNTPHKVERAVFLAAGLGLRMAPVTLTTPKPLVRVRGKRIIDTLLDAVVAAGIPEIYIVRGYLGEQFDALLSSYPMIRFIENPLYDRANNISSVYFAREFLGNAYILESDLLLRNPGLITAEQSRSNYLGVPAASTNDWCFDTRDGIITGIKVGGADCFHMFGISYWTKEDGERLGGHIEEVFSRPGGKDQYWDLVALGYFKDRYEISVRPCTFADITEIDTFEELQALDPAYRE
jgi:CTP:phosphocholine cytidylyltransferase-like protein